MIVDIDGATTEFGADASVDVDARVTCTSDVDCNDGLFCNGRDMCAPASTSADARGCVPGDAPCGTTETCDESANDCRTICEDRGPTCTTETFSPSLPTETCNATDDDCDGILDDGYACVRNSTGNACVTACGTPGTYTCTAACGVPTASTACAAAVETCNGCDDDRDGTLDEGFDADGMDPCFQGQTRPCTMPSGVAGATQVCRGDCRGWDTCRTADEGLANPPTCNAADDDGDGLVDEGFACAQNSITACSLTATAPVVSNTYPIVCGTVTNGRRRCDTNCAYLDSSCWTASEVCNYCEDDGNTATTDANIATAIVNTSFGTSQLTLAGSASFTGTALSERGVSLVSAGTALAPLFSRAGAVWTRGTSLTQPRPYVGWGPMTFIVQAEVSKGTTTNPADGWAVVLARSGTGDVDTGYSGSVGTPRSRSDSLAVEWRFYTGVPTTQADQVQVVVTNSVGTRTVLGVITPPAARHLDASTTGIRDQLLLITYIPDDPRTLYRDDKFELRFDATSVVPDLAFATPTSLGGGGLGLCDSPCMTSASFGGHLQAGYPFELGVIAAIGGSNANVRVVTALDSALGGDTSIPIRIDREAVCF